MRGYTSLEQSKKLAEILSLESADMCYIQDLLAGGKYGEYRPYIGNIIPAYGQDKIKCWSFAALLSLIKDKCGYFEFVYLKLTYDDRGNHLEDVYRLSTGVYDVYEKEEVDACYEMIIKLHEQNLL